MPRFKTAVIGEAGIYDGTGNRVYSPTNPQPAINPDPSDHGLKAWSFDPAPVPLNSSVLTAGTLNLVKMYVGSQPVTISSAYLQVVTAGATLTNVGVALYDPTGVRLTSSVNANGATATAFQSTGTKTITFSTPQTFSGYFYLGFWTTGTTQPALFRGTQSAAMNINLAAPNFRFAKSTTGLTTTAPTPFGTQTASSDAFFAAAA